MPAWCSVFTIALNSCAWPSTERGRTRCGGRRSRSCCNPSSCAGPSSCRWWSWMNWCTGISSIAVRRARTRWSITAGWATPSSAAEVLGHTGWRIVEPAHVGLVMIVSCIAVAGVVAAPVEEGVADDRSGTCGALLSRFGLSGSARRTRSTPVSSRRGRRSLGVGVDQQLAGLHHSPWPGPRAVHTPA